MQLTYFSNGNLIAPAQERQGVLVKDAIVAIEGRHRDNRGVWHEFSRKDIEEYGKNTNQEIAFGRSIALMDNHGKTSEAKLGQLTGVLVCREVTPDDLPHPEAQSMVGKLALFSKAAFVKKIEDVKSGIVKALSPGMDLGRKIIFEVSAVPIAAMPGVGLFSFEEIANSTEPFAEKIAKANRYLNIFAMAEVQQAISGGGEVATTTIANFDALMLRLKQIFEIPDPDAARTEIDGISYAADPYSKQIVNRDPAGFSYDTAVAEAAEIIAADRTASRSVPFGNRRRSKSNLPPAFKKA